IVTLEELRELASAPVSAADSRYRIPLERDARLLCTAMGADCEAVLLGSIATPKYIEPLGAVFGSRLLFPADFVGRGDMSRGSMLLRCVREGVQLSYSRVLESERNIQRSSKRPIRKLSQSKATEAVIFVGMQASGKTSFYLQNFADTHV